MWLWDQQGRPTQDKRQARGVAVHKIVAIKRVRGFLGGRVRYWGDLLSKHKTGERVYQLFEGLRVGQSHQQFFRAAESNAHNSSLFLLKKSVGTRLR
jgi:hypothetical protein